MNPTKYEQIYQIVKGTAFVRTANGRDWKKPVLFEIWAGREAAGEPIIGTQRALKLARAGVWSDPEDWSAGMVEKHGKLIPLLTLVYIPCEWVDQQIAQLEEESDNNLVGKLAIIEGAWS